MLPKWISIPFREKWQRGKFHVSGSQSQRQACNGIFPWGFGNMLKICYQKNIPKPSLCFLSGAKASKKRHYQKKSLSQSFEIQVELIGSDLDFFMSFQKSWQQQLSWREIKRKCAVPNVFYQSPDCNASTAAPKSKAPTFCSHHEDLDLDILDHVCRCTAYKPSSLHASQEKEWKWKPKNGGPRHVDLWHDVSQTFSCLHQIHSNYVKSSDRIKPPRQKLRTSKDTSSLTKFHPPCAWRS